MKVFGQSDIGKLRARNQDSYLIETHKNIYIDNLYIVADGMGGHVAGEVASSTAVNVFNDYINNTLEVRDNLLGLLLDATKRANEKVFFDSVNNEAYHGMGTTLTALTIKHGKGYVAHIGDSRIYRIRAGEMEMLTSDHSFVFELMRSGKITKEEAKHHPKRHILTRALGPDIDPLIDTFTFDVAVGDKYLMCTDGLTTMMDDEVILELILPNAIDEAVRQLVDKANDNGGLDNITAILIEIEDYDYAT